MNIKYLNSEITLPMILEQFVSEGKNLIWSILDIDFFGDFEKGEYYSDLLMRLRENNSEINYLSWNELVEISRKFTVLTDLKLIGCKEQKSILEIQKSWIESKKPYQLPSDIKQLYDILIFVDDDNLIDVCTKNKAISERCIKKFGNFPIRLYL